MVQQNAVILDNIFHALADPTRRAMVDRLGRGEASIGALAGPFDMTLTAASKHVHVLERAGLVRRRREGRRRICTLDAAGLVQAQRWLARYERFWTERLDALETELGKGDAK